MIGRALCHAIQPVLDGLGDELGACRDRMSLLRTQGITEARPSWQRGRGRSRVGDRYLYLVHPMRSGKRERECIGYERRAQSEALARVERWREWEQLRLRVVRIEDVVARADVALGRVLADLRDA